MQTGVIYRYLSLHADHDVSADVLRLSLDGGTTWLTGAVYIPTASLPPRVAALNAAEPVPAGATRYWWRILTGPGTSFPLDRGGNLIAGSLADTPETPTFGWNVYVGKSE